MDKERELARKIKIHPENDSFKTFKADTKRNKFR
jgi:hypothetical protein